MKHTRECKYSGLKLTAADADGPECCCPPMLRTTILDLLLAEPTEKNTVVRFFVAFEGSPKTYTYAAVKAPDLWFTTGTKGPIQGLTWKSLLEWVEQPGRTILKTEQATAWEAL